MNPQVNTGSEHNDQPRAVIVQPGQILIVRVDPKTESDDALEMVERLRNELPDVKVLVVACDDLTAIDQADKQRVLSELGLA